MFRKELFTIYTALSPHDAMKILEENEVQLIISDQMMPKMNGLDFYKKAQKMFPNTRRILISRSCDETEVNVALNNGLIEKYLTKPIDKESLLKVLTSIY